jgi:hypothetical protein
MYFYCYPKRSDTHVSKTNFITIFTIIAHGNNFIMVNMAHLLYRDYQRYRTSVVLWLNEQTRGVSVVGKKSKDFPVQAMIARRR